MFRLRYITILSKALLLSLILEIFSKETGFWSILLSFLISLSFCLLLEKKKLLLDLFAGFCSLLSVANIIKIHFQNTEVRFYDLSILKDAGGVASMFLSKIPYGKISIIFLILGTFYFLNHKSRLNIPYFFCFENGMIIQKKFKVKPAIFALAGVVAISSFFISYSESSFLNEFLRSSVKNTIPIDSLYGDPRPREVLEETLADRIKKELSTLSLKEDPVLKNFPYKKEAADLILIQSETFFDIYKDRDHLYEKGLVFEKDFLKNFHEYQKRGISGKLFTPVVGGMTVQTEYEVLTGKSSLIFGDGNVIFNNNLKKETPSLASFYKESFENTSAIGIHNHEATYWNRDKVYPLLGFDEFHGEEFFSKEQREDKYGAWMSDKGLFDKTVEVLKQKEEKNLFLFPSTVQNHAPFLEKRISPAMKENLKGEDAWQIYNYVANMEDSDIALKEMIDQIEKREKPTLVVFYGDHKPSADYEMFTKSPYYKEKQRLYSTDYFVYWNEAFSSLNPLRGTQKDLPAVSLHALIKLLLGSEEEKNVYLFSLTEENYRKDFKNKKSIFYEISDIH